MNKKVSISRFQLLFALISILFIPSKLYSQFEQKLSIHGSVVFISPDLLAEKIIYDVGIGLDGGIQFNLNRKFSLIGSVRFNYAYGAPEKNDFFQNLAFGGGFKYNFLSNGFVNPYCFGEFNLNLSWAYAWNETYDFNSNDDWIPPSEDYNSNYYTTAGGFGGVGLDIKIHDNFGIFVQSGSYYKLSDSMLNIYSQVGVRINMIKSKTI